MKKLMESILWNKVEEYFLNKHNLDFNSAYRYCHEEMLFLVRESNLLYATNSFREAWELCKELYQQKHNKNK